MQPSREPAAVDTTGNPVADEDDGSSSGGDEVWRDACEDAVAVVGGRFVATLRGATSQGGACGNEGPETFFAVDVPVRADVEVVARGLGFEPIVGVLGGRCSAAWDEALLCGTGGGFVSNVRAGVRLIIAVGIDPDAEVLQAEPGDTDEPDPLEIEVTVLIHPLRPEGSPCVIGQTRCEPGTTCAEASDGLRCIAPIADTCATAVAIDADTAELPQLTGDVPATDAHRHTCGGARIRERVFRLTPPQDRTDGGYVLGLTAGTNTLIAVRGESCLFRDELACGRGSVNVALDGGSAVYVFVEGDGAESVTVEWR